MPANVTEIEKRLWDAADELRANSKLKASEYSIPVLGLIFLRYADAKFTVVEQELAGTVSSRRRSQPGKAHYQAKGVLYLPETARFGTLLTLPEGENIGQAINDAMRVIEAENPDLKDVLPKIYNRLENKTLVELLKLMASISMDIFNSTITGTTVAHLGHKHIKTIQLIAPDSKTLEFARKQLESLAEMQINLKLRNQFLRQTRDLLLPKLISGELDVSKLESTMQSEEAAAA